MMQLPEDFDSIFRYIVVVSQRAEQLINGAKPRAEGRHVKQTLMARDDVDAGTVTWRILTQEELDAQRQAIVDQFRAEVASDETAISPAPIPDVLPTRREAPAEVAAEAQGGDRDDEIARLQRLLGMAGARGAAAGEDADDGDSDSDDADDGDDGDDFDDKDLALDLDDDFDSDSDSDGDDDEDDEDD